MKHPTFLTHTPFMLESERLNRPERPIARFWTLVRSCKASLLLLVAIVAMAACLKLWNVAAVQAGDVWEKSPTARDTAQREAGSFAF
jgi:hypothetical protein